MAATHTFTFYFFDCLVCAVYICVRVRTYAAMMYCVEFVCVSKGETTTAECMCICEDVLRCVSVYARVRKFVCV